MIIHENVKKTREEKKLSQNYVANELGLSQSQYSRRENGTIKFLADELRLLSQVLKTQVSVLYGEAVILDNQPQNNEDSEQQIALSEKVIDLYETRLLEAHTRLREKDELIVFLKKKLIGGG